MAYIGYPTSAKATYDCARLTLAWINYIIKWYSWLQLFNVLLKGRISNQRNYLLQKVIHYMFWLKESQKTVNLDIKIKYYKFPASKAATILTKVVTSQRLFMIIQASVINSYHLSFQFSDYARTRNASCALNLISIIWSSNLDRKKR